MRKKQIRLFLGWSVVLATSYFFIRALSRNWDNIQTIDFSVNVLSIISILLFTSAVIYSGLLWGGVLEDLTKVKTSKTEITKVHISSWLLKYIPGQAGSYLNKLSWGKKSGHSKKVVTISFVYENVFLILASVALSIPVVGVLFYDDVSGNLSKFAPLLLILGILPFLNKKVFYKLFNYIFMKLRNQSIDKEYFFDSKKLIVYFFKFMGPRIVTAAAFIFVAESFLPVSPDMWIGLGAIYVLAGIVGILAIFVPSGIGVREAVIVVLASNYFSPETAIALSLVARLYNTIADGLLALLYLGLRDKKLVVQK